MKEVKFLHIADLHLDSPFVGLKSLPKPIYEQIKEASYRSFQETIRRAVAEQVDFVLIAGDIYDKEDRSIKAQVQFYKEMKRLEEAKIDVFLIHGNHDFLEKGKDLIALPENVHTFFEEVSDMVWQDGDKKVKIYGFSYPARHVLENKTALYQTSGDADFHIAMLHGSELTKSSEHDVYAPFRLEEITRKGFDYWALGHIHKREILSENPGVYYPGVIQGRNRKEAGEKGGTIVTLNEFGVQFDFFQTAPIIWEQIRLEFKEEVTNNSLFRKLEDVLLEFENREASYILDIDVSINQNIAHEEWLPMLQDGRANETPFVWVNRLSFMTKKGLSKDWFHEGILQGELTRSAAELSEEEAFFKNVEPLYFHNGIRKFLPDITEDKRAQIVLQATKKVDEILNQVEGERK
ncbi:MULTISPECIES: DNA repair exonuclease [unclassified Listeria]|uniref:metallophosphoesterase family protein n=1 Tax=unclassified Listeria TaxID=2642072 RepID=UPI000B596D44|nr:MULTISPECIES: DNA repair exonuclease [unclassified Listeria]